MRELTLMQRGLSMDACPIYEKALLLPLLASLYLSQGLYLIFFPFTFFFSCPTLLPKMGLVAEVKAESGGEKKIGKWVTFRYYFSENILCGSGHFPVRGLTFFSYKYIKSESDLDLHLNIIANTFNNYMFSTNVLYWRRDSEDGGSKRENGEATLGQLTCLALCWVSSLEFSRL